MSYLPSIARGLWIGLVLVAVRGTLLVGMERVAHGDDMAQVLDRVAITMPDTVARMLGAAVLVALVAQRVRKIERPPARATLTAILTFAGAAGFFLLLSGWADDDFSRRVGTDTARGRTASWVLGAVALVLASFVSLRRPRDVRSRALALPAGLALVLSFALPAIAMNHGSQMSIHEPVGSLLATPERWESVRGDVRVDVVTPSRDYQLDGSDMPAVVLDVPGEARFDLGRTPGPVRLVSRAGIDTSVLNKHGRRLEGHSVLFEVALDGALLVATTIELKGQGRFAGTEWNDLGGHGGLDVSSGGVLSLSTTLVGPDGGAVRFDKPLTVGFGGMQLVRHWSVERERASAEHPNIVLIVMDTLRRDRVGTYGYGRPTTPNVDRLAARGVVFESAYSTASWTWPSTASILTGMLPEEHGVVGGASCYLADELVTLAEALQREGITTAGWSGNPLIVPDKNFDQGFEFFESGKASMRRSRVFVPGALEWLDSIAGSRFFLYLHLVDPHVPYDPRPDARRLLAADVPGDFGKGALHDASRRLLRGEGWSEDGTVELDDVVSEETRARIDDLYDACIRTGDHWVGRVLDRLEELGIDDETIVIFTSDHGEELFDHGHGAHGQAIHDELVHVPLIVAGPGLPAGRRVEFPVSNRHLGPTLARLGGAGLPELADAVDLFDVIGSPPSAPETIQFSTTRGWWKGGHPQTILGIQRGPLVLHFAPEGRPWGADESTIGDATLFDRGVDPGQTSDLFGDRPGDARSLRDELLRRVAECEARRRSPVVRAGSSTTDMLRGLGYLGDDE